MPTPRPIIDTSSGVIVLIVVRPARMNRSRNAVTAPTSASAIGMNIATKVRKTTSSTISAASRPSSSCVPCSIGGNSASPLYSTVTPAGSTASRTASWTARTASRSSSKMTRSNWASAYAIRPSSEKRVLAERIADALDPGLVLGRLRTRPSSAARRRPRSPPGARACRAARPRARRRRGSARRPAPPRTPTRSGRSPSACPSPEFRTRPAGCRRWWRRGRSEWR